VSTMLSVFEADRLVRVAALHDEALADPSRYGGGSRELVERSLRLELASAMRVTEYAAGELIGLADAVVHRYPAVLDSLAAARMTESHVKVLVAALDAAEPELRGGLVGEAVRLAETLPVGTFRRTFAGVVERARAITLEQRYADAVAERRVVVESAGDGMAWLMAYLPEVEARAVFRRATAIGKALIADDAAGAAAAGGAGKTRTLDQVRADVIADLLIEGDVTGHPKTARGIRAEVVVTAPVLSLLDGEGKMSGDLPVVEGVGPIPLSVAKELCGGAKEWMRVLTHPETGMVLSVGRTKYRAPKALEKLAKWRSERCMGPGCGMPASQCQIDHQLAWKDGGCTCLDNNAPLCQAHHTIKHHGGWVVTQIPDSGGVIEWISPHGRRYLVEPERRVPVFHPTPEPPPF
jgi:hypothetical protein